ncbi:uncharacterized protein B0H64DRAFT_453932 [Chaetomium fimeti]|uniref:Uncharacterized protein n=1 Tax=Chaetomium fimeti TaxID=1854472 RepID=A0AAE0LV09_9PEZI|nr:hypothetical protein B0H64DRAFT_453932 [Chaetomium fimeti]
MAEISRLSIALKVPGSPQLHPFQPNSVEYRYIASAVNIGLSILEQDRSILDETLNNLDILGHHPRMHWIGRLDQFPFRRQRFQLNAQRVRSMVAAGNGTSDAKRQRFRNFQFAFATVVVHELGGRMLITWLSKGRQGIPGIISAAIYDNGVSMEEAGPCLETRLFGGTTKFYRDPRQDDDQASTTNCQITRRPFDSV